MSVQDLGASSNGVSGFQTTPFLLIKSIGDILDMHLTFKCMYSECRQLLFDCQESVLLR